MYGAAGEKRPIFVESDAFLYNLVDPTIGEEENKPPIKISRSKVSRLPWRPSNFADPNIVTFKMIHSMYNSLI